MGTNCRRSEVQSALQWVQLERLEEQSQMRGRSDEYMEMLRNRCAARRVSGGSVDATRISGDGGKAASASYAVGRCEPHMAFVFFDTFRPARRRLEHRAEDAGALVREADR
jgi:hypothetical protein